MSLPPLQRATSLARSQVDERGRSLPLLPLRGVLQPVNVPNVPAVRADAAAEGGAVKEEANDNDEGDGPRRRASTQDTSGSALTPLPEDMNQPPLPQVRARDQNDYYEPGGVACAEWNFQLPRRRLDDQIKPRLDVLFCGKSPGQKAVELNRPFPESNSHTFYRSLHQSGWTQQEHPCQHAPQFPQMYNIGMTTLIRDVKIVPSTAQLRRHIPAWIEKILAYRPRVACVLAISDWLQTIETAFYRWDNSKSKKNKSYTKQPVSRDWVLRPWKIVHPDIGRGPEVTYIVAVVNPGGAAGLDQELRTASFGVVRDIVHEIHAGIFDATGIREVNLGPYHQIIADRDQMIADLHGRSPSLAPRKRSASASPPPSPPPPPASAVAPFKRARIGRSSHVNAVAGPSGTRHEGLDPIPAPHSPEMEMEVDDEAADAQSPAGASEPNVPPFEDDEDNKAAVAEDMARIRATDRQEQDQLRQQIAEIGAERDGAVADLRQERSRTQELTAELDRVRAENRDLAANLDRLTAEHAPFKTAVDAAAAARSVPSGSGSS